ncbi:MAG: hypothetical protein ABF807_01905 [Liquorilactobacillus nagelii]|uniref:cation transporter n=1 Tax=Liquorilactobacillus nagelii TaxID=82688 RepID=UPI0039E9098D
MQEKYQNLKIAQRWVLISSLAYVFLAMLKLVVGQMSHSATLLADASNNLTDILSSMAIIYDFISHAVHQMSITSTDIGKLKQLRLLQLL